jgi:hypothetical protein
VLTDSIAGVSLIRTLALCSVIDDAKGLSTTRSGFRKAPYTKDLAQQHWTPNDYLAGYYGQRQTRTEANTCMTDQFDSNRNSLALDGDNQVLEVDLPKNCIATECALQARFQVEQLQTGKLESATLSYRYAMRCLVLLLADLYGN